MLGRAGSELYDRPHGTRVMYGTPGLERGDFGWDVAVGACQFVQLCFGVNAAPPSNHASGWPALRPPRAIRGVRMTDETRSSKSLWITSRRGDAPSQRDGRQYPNITCQIRNASFAAWLRGAD